MAERRMFTKKVTDDDNFMTLSSSAQALYLHLSMSADDDGFCNQVTLAMFKAHASVQDLEALLEKRYIYQFENGVIVIKHWRMANALRKDRYTPTAFQEELKKLALKDNGSYTWLPDGCHLSAECLPQDRLGKDRLDEDRIGKNSLGEDSLDNKESKDSMSFDNDYQTIIDLWNTLDGLGNIKGIISISTGSKRRDCTRARLKEHGIEGFADAIEQIKKSSFLQGNNNKSWTITFDWFIRPNNFIKVLEGNYSDGEHTTRITEVDSWV